MSDEEKDKREVGNIKDVRPDVDEAEQEEQARKEVEERHDLVAGDADLDEVEEQREAEQEELAEDGDDEDEDDFLKILCRRPDQSGGSCGASKASLVADNQHSKRYRCADCKGVWTVQTGGAFPY